MDRAESLTASRVGTQWPGVVNASPALEEVAVCAPAPPSCEDAFSWLERSPLSLSRRGVQCESSMPDPADLEIPPMPTCRDIGRPPPGGGCSADPAARGGASVGLLAFGLVVVARRRRRRLARRA